MGAEVFCVYNHVLEQFLQLSVDVFSKYFSLFVDCTHSKDFLSKKNLFILSFGPQFLARPDDRVVSSQR